MEIHNSREDYLEAVLVLGQKSRAVRSVDIAEHLGFSKASVSRAMSQLAESGLIRIDESKHIMLTDEGIAQAEKVYEKHRFFLNLLQTASVDGQQAAEDACKIEHAISDESFEALRESLVERQKET